MTDREGQQFGNYRLIRLLGRGGSADTYLAEHIYMNTFAAVKILQTWLSQNDEGSFFKEARTIANLQHPNIIRVLDFGSAGKTPYFVMDYAPNGTLRQRHQRGMSLPLKTIIPYVKQMAAALQYAHSQRVIHRDVKPENMLIGAEDEILLSDFGIAVIDDKGTKKKRDIAGTVTYMAPEQLRGMPLPASDQYALGIVVYEWLCGAPPFLGSQIEVALQQERNLPPSLRERVPSLPIEVEQVVLMALSKDPGRRFANIQIFANALEQVSEIAPTDVTVISVRPDEEQFIETQMTPGRIPLQRPPGYSGKQSPIQAPERESWLDSSTQASSSKKIPSIADAATQRYYQAQPVQEEPYSVQRGAQMYQQAQLAGFEQVYIPETQAGRPSSLSDAVKQKLTLTIMALLLIVGGVLAFFFAAYLPNQQHLQAVATIQAYATSTAQAQILAKARAQATTQAQTQAIARQNLYRQTSGTPALNDSMQAAGDDGWDIATYIGTDGKPIGNCNFTGNAYHSKAVPNDFIHCLAEATNYNNLAYQAEITIMKGHYGGLIVHAQANGSGYYFGIGTDSTYILQKIHIDDNTGIPTYTTLASGVSNIIKTGNNQPNLLAAITHGSNIYIYINKEYVDAANDRTYPSGRVGMYSDGDMDAAEVIARNAQVWQLP